MAMLLVSSAGGSGLILVQSVTMGGETNVWAQDKPTDAGLVVYGLLIPLFALFGAVANCINGIVFMRPRMTPSAFIYLAAMSWIDCISCLLLIFSSMAQSIFLNQPYWLVYDIQFQIPLIGVTTGAANLILVSVTYDRLVYVKNVLAKGAPRFCCRKVAKLLIVGIVIFVFLLNIPYFFVYEKNDSGEYTTSSFYHSRYYTVHNWINFIVLGLFPAIFLLIANTIMLAAIRKWCQSHCICSQPNNSYEKKRYYYQIRLTATIIAVTFVFFIGDLPQHLLSRKSAIVLLFHGDMSYAESTPLETVRMVSAVLNILQLSFNILIYATLNPAFLIELFECLRIVSDRCFNVTGINLLVKSAKTKRDDSQLCSSQNNGKCMDSNEASSCANVCDKDTRISTKVCSGTAVTINEDAKEAQLKGIYTISDEGSYYHQPHHHHHRHHHHRHHHYHHHRAKSCKNIALDSQFRRGFGKHRHSLPCQLNAREL